MNQETFGPVLAIKKVRSDEEAIELANSTPFGLNASIWSNDIPRAKRIALKLKAGQVSINDVAQKAGVSPVTIYNYFGSKEELVRRAVKSQLTSMIEKYREVIEEDVPFPEIMETIVFDKADIASQYQGELMQTAIQSDPELKGFIGTRVLSVISILSRKDSFLSFCLIESISELER